MVETAKQVDLGKLGKERILPDRVTPLIEAARGKSVLNIGCAGSDALTASNPVHARIASVSTHCVGLDIYEAGVRKLAGDGFDVVYANAEDFDLPRKDFEVATMGDVIEHVSNPGRVFDCVNRHLVPGGLVAVTTPNPFSLTLMLRMLLRRPYIVNSEHVFWFDPPLLSFLLERSGFEPVELWWMEQSRIAPLRKLQEWHKPFHGTFGFLARKVA
jgi:2-polyprenyl-3-methyl-5-hydroxy-6-metoxy-1,4-benzoquinol methylase